MIDRTDIEECSNALFALECFYAGNDAAQLEAVAQLPPQATEPDAYILCPPELPPSPSNSCASVCTACVVCCWRRCWDGRRVCVCCWTRCATGARAACSRFCSDTTPPPRLWHSAPPCNRPRLQVGDAALPLPNNPYPSNFHKPKSISSSSSSSSSSNLCLHFLQVPKRIVCLT